MSNADVLQLILDRVESIDTKLDGVIERGAEDRVRVEGRLARVETKASIFGTLAGFIAGILANTFHWKV